ncbi:MAG: Holliday junction resolvase RuvX [Spirosomataceae bacterium]|jgi:putative Holliday junction resolvase|nr:Holliday junction resolvase RuvX [Flectobacillus sp.]
MGRLVAIDYGTKRVGIAVTDPLKIIASALETVHAKDIISFLKEYIEREEVEALIVGMPVRLDGTDTDNTPHVKGFVKLLGKTFPEMPVHLHDERFTSAMALQVMLDMGTTKKARKEKGNIDKLSATIILQSYMESLSHGTF